MEEINNIDRRFEGSKMYYSLELIKKGEGKIECNSVSSNFAEFCGLNPKDLIGSINKLNQHFQSLAFEEIVSSLAVGNIQVDTIYREISAYGIKKVQKWFRIEILYTSKENNEFETWQVLLLDITYWKRLTDEIVASIKDSKINISNILLRTKEPIYNIKELTDLLSDESIYEEHTLIRTYIQTSVIKLESYLNEIDLGTSDMLNSKKSVYIPISTVFSSVFQYFYSAFPQRELIFKSNFKFNISLHDETRINFEALLCNLVQILLKKTSIKEALCIKFSTFNNELEWGFTLETKKSVITGDAIIDSTIVERFPEWIFIQSSLNKLNAKIEKKESIDNGFTCIVFMTTSLLD